MCDTLSLFFFFFNDTSTTEIYTLSLHDALPIFGAEKKRVPADDRLVDVGDAAGVVDAAMRHVLHHAQDRKSTRLNSSHSQISYAVFCLKKKTNHRIKKYNP